MTGLFEIERCRAIVVSLFLMLAMALVVSACSDSGAGEEGTGQVAATAVPTESPPQPMDTPTPAPTPVPTATPEPTPTPTAMPGPYPLQITDMLGQPVEILAEPMRIVSISPTATEMLYVAGGEAVARDSSSTFPDEVLGLPEMGGAYSPNFEAIAAQGADLILIEA